MLIRSKRRIAASWADDAHGTPIMLSAQQAGITPEQLIEQMNQEHQRDFRDFGLSFDNYSSTHSPANRELVETIYQRLREGGYVEQKTISQFFDEQEGMFLPDRFIRGTCPKCRTEDQYGDSCEACGSTYAPTDLIEPRSAVSGTPPVMRESEHYFVRLGDFQERLHEWMNSGRMQKEVINKSDLGTSSIVYELDTYFDIGYDVVACSALTGEGIENIRRVLASHRAIIVGQSGVGKSSIINSLIGDEVQKTSQISDKSREGRHTTVNSVMIELPGGGAVVDSPGVRDYAPALESSTLASQGFREIREAAQNCRFANCRHLREPGCAVKDLCESGEISPRRYESFKRIVNLTEQLAEGRY